MKKSAVIILCAFILLPSLAMAQRWKSQRQQLFFGAGITNFFGELGGGNSTGRSGPADIDMAATRPALMAAYRYKINQYFSLRSNLTWGILNGDDKYTNEPFRKGRNLSFRSSFFDLNVIGEFYFLPKKSSNLYNLRGVNNNSGFWGINPYLFTGIGLMHFNPKAKYEGKWIALQPIGTEGQGLPGEKDKYSRFTITIPYGIGLEKSIDRLWSVGIEASARITFTDYIDDVSTTYYGRENLKNAKLAAGASQQEAERAAYLSDPNIYDEMSDIGISKNNQLAGEKRGDPSNNDAFVTLMFTVQKKIRSRRRGRAKF